VRGESVTDRMRSMAGVPEQTEGADENAIKPSPALLKQLAKKYFDIDNLATQKSDRLDFHEVAVWSIEDALSEAFAAGWSARAKWKKG
jgi:hypothetical protein